MNFKKRAAERILALIANEKAKSGHLYISISAEDFKEAMAEAMREAAELGWDDGMDTPPHHNNPYR